MKWDTSWKEQFHECGDEVYIGDYCFFASPDKVVLKNRVRIDPLGNFTCGILADENIHIGPQVFFNGGPAQRVHLGAWSFVGGGSRLITASDDYTGDYGPIGPWGDNRMDRGDIALSNFSGVAVGTTLLPGVVLPTGTCIAGHGFVTAAQAVKMEPWMVYAVPPGGQPRPLYHRNEKQIVACAMDPKFLKGYA